MFEDVQERVHLSRHPTSKGGQRKFREISDFKVCVIGQIFAKICDFVKTQAFIKIESGVFWTDYLPPQKYCLIYAFQKWSEIVLAFSFHVSILHVHAVCPWCMSMLHVHVACLCWMSMVHVFYACSCYMSLLHVYAAFQCCLPVMHVHFECIFCMPRMYVNASCSCFMIMLHLYVSMQHVHAAC